MKKRILEYNCSEQFSTVHSVTVGVHSVTVGVKIKIKVTVVVIINHASSKEEAMVYSDRSHDESNRCVTTIKR